MASITVSSSGYWGDPTLGNWSGLVLGDTVTVNANLIVDQSVYTPTNISSGAAISCTNNFASFTIINSSTTTPLVYYGNYQGSMAIRNSCSLIVSGDYINIYSGNGAANQTTSGWLTIGYAAVDEPGSVEVETASGTNIYNQWVNIGNLTMSGVSGYAGVGELGNWFSYNSGIITFGDGGKPQYLTVAATSGTNSVTVASATNFNSGDLLHIIENSTIRERIYVTGKSVNTLTISGNYGNNLEHSYTTNAFVRLTYGGNLVPSGANVRVYNIGIGCRSTSGPLIGNTYSNQYQLNPNAGGIINLNKMYAFGFYMYFLNSKQVTATNTSTVLTNSFINVFNSTVSNCVNAPSNKYISTEAYAFYFERCSNITISGCISVRNSYYAIHSTSCNLMYFYNTRALDINRTTAFNYAFNIGSSSKNHTFYNCYSAGLGSAFNGKNHYISGFYASDSIKGFPIGSNNNTQALLDSDTIIEDFRILDDGNENTSPFINGGYILKNFYNFRTRINKNLIIVATRSQVTFYNLNYGTRGTYNVLTIASQSAKIIRCKNLNNYNNQFITAGAAGGPGTNTIIKQCDFNNRTIYGGAGYDCSFYEARLSSTSGCIGLFFHPKNLSDDYTTSSNSDIQFNFAGSIYIINNSGWIEYTWPHWIKGITSFSPSGSITLTGNNTNNFTTQFKINTGSGYTSEWESLTQSGLANYNEQLDPDSGFKMKIKISKTSGNIADYLTVFNWETILDYDTYYYPENEVNITLQNVVDGSEYYIYNQTTNSLIVEGTQSGSSDILIPNVEYPGSDCLLLIRVRKSSASPKYIPFETNAILSSTGATVWVSQVRDYIAT